MWFDEGGELDPELSKEIVAGALPIMDTRPAGQVIVSGTPGKMRAGMFWDDLEAARADPARYGIVDYSADDLADPEDESLWWATHPGLACGLTTIDIIRERLDKLGLPKFMMEYLCIWPPDSTVTALDQAGWESTKCEPEATAVDLPWGIGYDVEIGGASAAIAVAWYDGDGEPHVQVIEHRQGTVWMDTHLLRAVQTHPRVLIGYDNIGDNIATAQSLQRLPRFRAKSLKALSLREVAAATATIARGVDDLTLHHAAHASLDAAVTNAGWRESGGSRLFGRTKGRDICALMACVHALAVAATLRQRTTTTLPEAITG